MADLPLLVFSGVSIWWVHMRALDLQQIGFEDDARDMTRLIDQALIRVETGLAALTVSSALQQGDLDGFKKSLSALSGLLDGTPLGLIGADGRLVFSSVWRPGEPHPETMAGPAARRAMELGQADFSNLVISDTTGAKAIEVVVPIVLPGQDRTAYALTASLSPDRLSAVIRPQPGLLARHGIAGVLDREGTIIARTAPETDVIGQQASPVLLARLRQQSAGAIDRVTSRVGDPVFVAFAHAPISGYVVVLAVPNAILLDPIRSDLLWTLGIGIILTAMGLAGATFLSRRLASSLHSLTQIGSQAPAASGLSEIDELAETLHWAAVERAQIQASVVYQLSLLRAVTESTAEAIFLCDADGRVTYANPQAERLFGWRQDKLIGQVLHDVIPRRRPDGTPSTLGESGQSRLATTDETTNPSEEAFSCQDGSILHADTSRSPVIIDGKIVGTVTSIRDVSARRRTDAVPRENEARLRDLIDTLNLAAIMVRDINGTIRFWSHGCQRLYGWSDQEAIGRSAHDLLQTRFPVPLPDIEEVLSREGEWSGDLIHRCHDGTEIVVAARKVLRRDAADRPQVMESLVDITALRQAQAELLKFNQQLEQRVAEALEARSDALIRAAQAERVQALGQLAGGIAHDFNNVLQAVAGGAALIQRNPGDLVMVRRLVSLITEATGRGELITRRMLVFARCDTLRADLIDPAMLLEGVRQICGYMLGAAIDIRVRLPADIPFLLADKGQLETALINLAANARDAMPEGGTLTFAAAAEQVMPGVRPGESHFGFA